MEKARVLEFYKIDDQAYQSTCSAIELKNPATLTGVQLDQFDKVRGWLDSNEVKNFIEAKKRLKAEQEAAKKPAEIDADILKYAEPAAIANADAALETVLDALQDAQKQATEAVVGAFNARLIAGLKSPEFQKRLMQTSSRNSNIIEAEFTKVQENPVLPASQS